MKTKHLRIAFGLLAALMAVPMPFGAAAAEAAASVSEAAGPVLIGGRNDNDNAIQLFFDKPLTAGAGSLELPETELGKFHLDVPGVRIQHAFVYGTVLSLFLDRGLDTQQAVDVTIDAGVSISGAASPIQPVSSFRIVTLAGRLAMLNGYDSAGTGFNVQHAVAYLRDRGSSNIAGLPGIGKEDVRYLLRQTETTREFHSALENAVSQARSLLLHPGDRPASAIAALQAQIDASDAVLKSAGSTERQKAASSLALKRAINAFLAHPYQQVELSHNGKLEGMSVNLTDQVVVAPAGLTVAQMLAALVTTYDIKVYPSATSATEASPSDAVTSAMKIKVSTSPEKVYSVQLAAIADTYGKVTAALADAGIDVIVIKGQIAAPNETLTIGRSVYLTVAAPGASLEVKQVLVPVNGFRFASDLFITNASTEDELLSRVRGLPSRIRVTNVDGYTGFLTRRQVGSYAFYAGTNGTAYVDFRHSLQLAMADASIGRIFLLDNITVPGTLTFPTDRTVTYAASSGKTITAGAYVNHPAASQLVNVALAGGGTETPGDPYLTKKTGASEDVEIAAGRIYVPYGMTAGELLSGQIAAIVPAHSLSIREDDYAESPEVDTEAELGSGMVVKVVAGTDVTYRIVIQQPVSTFPELYSALHLAYDGAIEAVKIKHDITELEADLTITEGLEIRSNGSYTVRVRSIFGAAAEVDARIAFVGHADNDFELSRALDSALVNSIEFSGTEAEYSGILERDAVARTYFTKGSIAYAGNTDGFEAILAGGTAAEVYLASDISLAGTVTFPNGLTKLAAARPRNIVADTFANHSGLILSNVKLVKQPIVLQSAQFMGSVLGDITRLPSRYADFGLEIMFSRDLTPDEQARVESAFKAAVSGTGVSGSDLDIDWYDPDNPAIYNNSTNMMYFPSLITAQLSDDPATSPQILLDARNTSLLYDAEYVPGTKKLYLNGRNLTDISIDPAQDIASQLDWGMLFFLIDKFDASGTKIGVDTIYLTPGEVGSAYVVDDMTLEITLTTESVNSKLSAMPGIVSRPLQHAVAIVQPGFLLSADGVASSMPFPMGDELAREMPDIEWMEPNIDSSIDDGFLNAAEQDALANEEMDDPPALDIELNPHFNYRTGDKLRVWIGEAYFDYVLTEDNLAELRVARNDEEYYPSVYVDIRAVIKDLSEDEYLYKAQLYDGSSPETGNSSGVYDREDSLVIDRTVAIEIITPNLQPIGSPVTVKSGEGGAFYLVPSAKTVNSVGELYGELTITSVAGTAVSFDPTSLSSGSYIVYMVDEAGNLGSHADSIILDIPA